MWLHDTNECRLELEALLPDGVQWGTDLAAAHLTLARLANEPADEITITHLMLEICELASDLSLAASKGWAAKLQCATRIRQVASLAELLLTARQAHL